jgi:secreted trypsin-like serine protease
MLAIRRGITLLVAAATMLVLPLTASPAGAVIDGTDDTANRFQNVGALQLRLDGDEWAIFCSGTLVAENVVLTAAHCVDFFTAEVGEEGLGPDDLRVSFDVAPDETSTYYYAESIVVHPDWLTAPAGRGNSKHLYLAPPAEDIALVWLKDAVSGVDPAPIADAGYLDTLDLTSETFTVVGYGLDGFVTGTIISPRAVVIDDGTRSYRDVSVITTHDAFPDRFVKITRSTCFGDSGGPLFHEGTVVGINTWTFSPRCSGPNSAYRTDSGVAQAFLDTYLSRRL